METESEAVGEMSGDGSNEAVGSGSGLSEALLPDGTVILGTRSESASLMGGTSLFSASSYMRGRAISDGTSEGEAETGKKESNEDEK